MAKESRAFGSQRAYKRHLTLGKGGVAGEVADLRRDAEEGFQNLEERAGYPELDFIDGAGPVAAGGDTVLVGRALLQGQTFDTLKLTEGAAELDVWPVKPGKSGISVVMTVGAGGLVVTFAASVLTIELAAGGSSDDAVATEINNGAACTGYIRATSAAGGNFTAVQASQAMAGGAGDYAGNKVMVAGKECLPKKAGAVTTSAAVWTGTQIDVTVPALTPTIATDKAQFTVSSDGTRADALSAAVGRTNYPVLDALDPGTLLAAGQVSFTVVGRNLLQGQTFDTLTTGLANAAVIVTNLKPGDSGFRLVVTQGVGALAVTFVNGLLTVELAAANSTATQVTAAINALAGCIGVIHAVAGGTGADDVLVAVETPFAGGSGLYTSNHVHINGQSCLPVHAANQWTDTGINVLVPALTARVATDIVAVAVESDGAMTSQLSALLT